MEATEKKDKNIHFDLTRNEAIVFFDWLSRFTAEEKKEHFVHDSESQILFNFEACLEKILSEPFDKNYSKIVKHAQNQVFPGDST